MVLNFETEKLMQELKERKPKRVLIQLPEGIKQNAFDILKDIDSLGIEVIFSGETCWGGCAVSVDEAKNVGADLIIHFGHSEFIKVDFPVLYVEVKDELDLTPFLEKSVEGLKDFKTIGLSYAIQHKQDLESIINFYEEKGHKVIISGKKGVASYAGHVVGCEFSGLKIIEKEVDCFVIIGNNFHSMGAALAVSKPVFLVDVYNDSFTDMEEIRQKTLKERFVSIEKFKKSKKIGIIVESKVGQKFGSLDFLITLLVISMSCSVV